MKVLFVICGALLLTLVAHAMPCEECDEEAPLAIPDENVLKVKFHVPEPEPSFEEESIVKPSNVIDAPVVCPPGQKPDHKGKCREVWGKAVPEQV